MYKICRNFFNNWSEIDSKMVILKQNWFLIFNYQKKQILIFSSYKILISLFSSGNFSHFLNSEYRFLIPNLYLEVVSLKTQVQRTFRYKSTSTRTSMSFTIVWSALWTFWERSADGSDDFEAFWNGLATRFYAKRKFM